MLEDPWFDASAPEHKDMYKAQRVAGRRTGRTRLYGVAI